MLWRRIRTHERRFLHAAITQELGILALSPDNGIEQRCTSEAKKSRD